MIALPSSDIAIDALAPTDRARIGAAWAGRSAAEGGAAENFRLISRSLHNASAAQALIDIAEHSVQDEQRHAEMCRQVASAYVGREVPLPTPTPSQHPAFAGAPDELVALLHIVGNCCFNETTATAYLELCLRHSRGATVRAALRALLTDDIDHARLGWSCLASALAETPSLSPLLSRYLLPLTKMNLRTWHVGTTQLAAFPEHGCPSRVDVDRVVIMSLRELILPGFERAGLDIGEASAWLDSRDNTAENTSLVAFDP